MLHVLSCQLMSAQVAQVSEVGGCFPKGTNGRAEHTPPRAIFIQSACERTAFARWCAVKPGIKFECSSMIVSVDLGLSLVDCVAEYA